LYKQSRRQSSRRRCSISIDSQCGWVRQRFGFPRSTRRWKMRRRKKPSAHNQFYSVVKGKGHHGEKGGGRWRRGRIRVGKRAGEEEWRRKSMDGRRFPPRALEQRAARLASGWGSSGDDPHACPFLAPSGQSAHGRYKLQCRGSRLHNVVLPTATDASSSYP
jgi:hypothetical protein